MVVETVVTVVKGKTVATGMNAGLGAVEQGAPNVEGQGGLNEVCEHCGFKVEGQGGLK